MGTTESIFYDDDTGEDAVIDSVAGSATSASNPGRSGGGVNDGVVHSRSAGMSPRDRPSPSTASQQWQEGPKRRSVIPSEAAVPARRVSPSPHHNTDDVTMLQRHRGNGNRPPTKPLRRIEGWLGGSTQTGKRSLLMRLQGRDPFPPAQTPQPSSSSSNRDPSDEDTITVPYRPPEGCHSLDRIQLHIKNMSKITPRNDDGGRLPDFAVILINPLDEDLGSVHNYVYQAVIQYATRLGYGDGNKQNNDNDGDNGDENDEGKDDNSPTRTKDRNLKKDDNAKKKKEIQWSSKPLCLCLAWNFRDLLNERHGKRQYSMYTERRDLLIQLVNNALKSLGVLPNQSKLVFIETSMKNCYGLDRLHQFIYRSYLELKRYELQRILLNVQDQIETIDGREDEMYRNEQSYTEFLAVLSSAISDTPSEEGAQKSSSKPPSRPETGKNGNTSSKHELETSQETTSEKPRQDKSNKKNTTNGTPVVPSLQRTVMHTKDQTKRDSLASKVGQDALEAFLASSSDEDDAPSSSKKGKSKSRKILNAKSGPFYADADADAGDDDDDDDDFFYDAEGRQHAHQEDDSSDSDDSTTGGDPGSPSTSCVDPVELTPVDASDNHDDQGEKSESSDLDQNDQNEMDETPSGHRQTIEKVEHSQNITNEDSNQDQTNPAARQHEDPAISEDPMKGTANTDDRRNAHQNDEDSTQLSIQVESPPMESESGQVSKGESIGSESLNGYERDIQGSLDDGNDIDLKPTDFPVDTNGPTDDENNANVQDDDSDDSTYLISTNSKEQEEERRKENQRGEKENLAGNDTVQVENQEAGVLEKDPACTDPHVNSIEPTTASSPEKEEMETSESDNGEGVDVDEDDGGFIIESSTDRNDKEGDGDRKGDDVHLGTTQSDIPLFKQSASSPEQSTSLSAAALAAIQAAQAQAEAMIELPNHSFPEKDAKKKKKKKDKDERKSKKEKKRKKSKSVDKDIV